ncbi:MAG: acyltransferase family protein [Porphyrobacter sp.]|nr:acyltransferase family protein [Porphyrobacter sp.]
MQSRLAGADGLRALACLLVVFHHLALRTGFEAGEVGPDWLVPFISNGGFGVVIFFVLSGFLLGRPFWVALEAGDRFPSLRTYALRRFARITPGFLVALCASLAIALLYEQSRLDGMTLLRFLLGATFLSAFYAPAIFPSEVNGPLWSISFEVWSYLLMPLAFAAIFALPKVAARRAGRLALWLAVIAAAVALHVAYIRFLPRPAPPPFGSEPFTLIVLGKVFGQWFSIFGMFAIFAIGVLAAGLQVIAARRPGAWADLVAAACLAGAVWICADFDRSGYPGATLNGIFGLPYNQYPLFPSLIGGFLVAAPSSRWLGHLLDRQPMRYLATISFGIYIYHMVILFIVADALFGPDGNATTGAGLAAMIGLVLAGAIALAHVSWHRLEKPVIEWARRFEHRVPRAPAAEQAF